MFNPTKCLNIVKQCKNPNTVGKLFTAAESLKANANSKFDVVIIGAGCVGSSIAFWLKKTAGPAINILVIDRDLKYGMASTPRSAGGVRQQFTLKENALLSKFGAEFVLNTEKYLGKSVDVQFNPHGYLTLANEDEEENLKTMYQTTKACGDYHKLIPGSELAQKYPWLNAEDIKVACVGSQIEGWLDPTLYLSALKDAAKEVGVQYLEAVPLEFNYNKIKVDKSKSVEGFSDEQRILNHILVKTPSGETKKFEFNNCIVATGADTGKFGRELLDLDRTNPGALQFELPIERRKRFLFVLESPCKDIKYGDPELIDRTTLMVRKERTPNIFTCGMSPTPDNEPSTDDLEVDHEFFDHTIWPVLAYRIPSFEACRVKSAWAGFYDYNFFDYNAIIGTHPAYKNMLIVSGFSGHGLQHSAGVGRAVSELYLTGSYQTLDLSCFSFDRVIKNKPILEDGII